MRRWQSAWRWATKWNINVSCYWILWWKTFIFKLNILKKNSPSLHWIERNSKDLNIKRKKRDLWCWFWFSKWIHQRKKLWLNRWTCYFRLIKITYLLVALCCGVWPFTPSAEVGLSASVYVCWWWIFDNTKHCVCVKWSYEKIESKTKGMCTDYHVNGRWTSVLWRQRMNFLVSFLFSTFSTTRKENKPFEHCIRKCCGSQSTEFNECNLHYLDLLIILFNGCKH